MSDNLFEPHPLDANPQLAFYRGRDDREVGYNYNPYGRFSEREAWQRGWDSRNLEIIFGDGFMC